MQTTVTNRLDQTADQARAAASRARVDLLWSIVIGVLFAGVVIVVVRPTPFGRNMSRPSKRPVQSDLTQRIAFEARLQRASEMSKAGGSVFDLVAEALSQAAQICGRSCCSPTPAGLTSARCSSAPQTTTRVAG